MEPWDTIARVIFIIAAGLSAWSLRKSYRSIFDRAQGD